MAKHYFDALMGNNPDKSETKNQPKEEVLGRMSLWTSGQKLRSGPPIPGKKQAFRHRHAPRTSTKELRSEKLRADFSFPNKTHVRILQTIRGLGGEINNITMNFSGRIPGGRAPGKEPCFPTPKVYGRPLLKNTGHS